MNEDDLELQSSEVVKKHDRKTKFNNERIIDMLIQQYRETNLMPTYKTIEGVSPTTIDRYFGNLDNALVRAGIISEKDIITKKTQVKEKLISKQEDEIEFLKEELLKSGKSNIFLLRKVIEKDIYQEDEYLLNNVIESWNNLLNSIDNLNNNNIYYIHIKDLLENNNIKHSNFAKEVGVTRNLVDKWCQGKTNIHENVLEYIEKRFKVDKNLIIPQKKLNFIKL